MKYFAYGTNMNKEQISDRCSYAEPLSCAKYPEHKLIFNSRGVATIIPDSNSVVYGVLYEITQECLNKLDSFEGYPKHYDRKEIKVVNKDGDLVEATVYIANDTEEGEPRGDDLRKALKGAKQHNLPSRYIKTLKDNYEKQN